LSTTDVIAAVALAVSFASAAAAAITLLLSFRESKRRDEEIRLLRREADRREEELGILRQQLAAGEEERRRQRQAHIAVRENVPTDGSSRGIEYTVTVQNIGIYPAADVMVDLVNGLDESVGKSSLGRSLVANEEAVVKVMTPPADRYTGPYRIFVVWVDGRGPQRQASTVQVGKP
jgi:hypothetical protein